MAAESDTGYSSFDVCDPEVENRPVNRSLDQEVIPSVMPRSLGEGREQATRGRGRDEHGGFCLVREDTRSSCHICFYSTTHSPSSDPM